MRHFLKKFNLPIDEKFLNNLIELQKEIMVHYDDKGQEFSLSLDYNLDDYVRDIQNGLSTELIKYNDPKICTISKFWGETGDKKEFARNIVWYGRKGGHFINKFV